MIRWTSLLLMLLLGGCVTYPTYTYRDDGYPRDSRYVGDDSYYASADDGYGDYYYYGGGGYRYSSSGYRYYAPDYLSYSAYYSLFWPVNRYYHDPYWHPGFYYGVTYFPRNYFSVSFYNSFHARSYYRSGYAAYRPYYGYSHWYSPYRNSWADSYYDWDRHRYQSHDNRLGHGRYSNSLYAPRYGNARNQAERLAWQERQAPAGRGERYGAQSALRGGETYRDTGTARGGRDRNGYVNEPAYNDNRAPSRGADYRGRTAAREPLQNQSFGVPSSTPRASRTWDSESAGTRSAVQRNDLGDSRGSEPGYNRGRGASDGNQSYELPRVRRVERVQRESYSESSDARVRRYDSGSLGQERRAPVAAPAEPSNRNSRYDSERTFSRPVSQVRSYAPAEPADYGRTQRAGRGEDEASRRDYSNSSSRQESFRQEPPPRSDTPAPDYGSRSERDDSSRSQRGAGDDVQRSSRSRDAQYFD